MHKGQIFTYDWKYVKFYFKYIVNLHSRQQTDSTLQKYSLILLKHYYGGYWSNQKYIGKLCQTKTDRPSTLFLKHKSVCSLNAYNLLEHCCCLILPKTEFPCDDERPSSAIFAESRHYQSKSENHRCFCITHIYTTHNVICESSTTLCYQERNVSTLFDCWCWLKYTGWLASLYLELIKAPAPCCNLAMASCLCSLSNRKWPPLCCCCRLKAHRLARCLKPPFWSHRTESRQQRREGPEGGQGAEVRDFAVVVMAKEQWGRWPGGWKN